MMKMTNKDLIVTSSIGLLATIILVAVFQFSFGKNNKDEEQKEAVNINKNIAVLFWIFLDFCLMEKVLKSSVLII